MVTKGLVVIVVIGAAAGVAACEPAGSPAAPRSTFPSPAEQPRMVSEPPALPPAPVAPPPGTPDPRFYVPPLPPEAQIPRWQAFCWAGGEALAHLDEAGAQGWELVSVTMAATPGLAVPRSARTAFGEQTIRSEIVPGTSTVLVCFKRPVLSSPGPR